MDVRVEEGPQIDVADLLDRHGTEFGREVHEIVHRQSLELITERTRRVGLGRRVPLARHVSGGNRRLLDRPEGLSRFPVACRKNPGVTT